MTQEQEQSPAAHGDGSRKRETMREAFALWLAKRTAKRQRGEVERSFIDDAFGPYPPEAIDRWDRAMISERIARKELSPIERAYAESRLRILEEEDGPAGRSARIAAWALWVSVASALLALVAIGVSIVALRG